MYISNHCPSCKVVAEYINTNSLACKVVNVDSQSESPPVDLWVFPALFEDKRLLAYGDDIIIRLSRLA
ncbi:MAG: hypothetical protein ACFB10_20450 [Salibacteraceae bacterium]